VVDGGGDRRSTVIACLAMAGAAVGLIFATSAARAGPLPAPSPDTSTLIVKVAGLRNARGKIDALLFRSADGFPDKDSRATASEAVPIDPKTLTAEVTFPNVPRGPAAVTVLHDENMNEKLDTNILGIPREGYGASNNPKKRYRAPTFAEAQFVVSQATQTIHINVIYW
jgi:uncharacterized protein (DUF2141 family)